MSQAIDMEALSSKLLEGQEAGAQGKKEVREPGVSNRDVRQSHVIGWKLIYQLGAQAELWNAFEAEWANTAKGSPSRKIWGAVLSSLGHFDDDQPEPFRKRRQKSSTAPPTPLSAAEMPKPAPMPTASAPPKPATFLDPSRLKSPSTGPQALQIAWARKEGLRLVDAKLDRLLSNEESSMPPNLEVVDTPFGSVVLAPSATRFFEGALHTVCFTYNGELPRGKSIDLAVDEKGRAFIRSLRSGQGGLLDGESVWVRVLILTEGSKMKYWAKNDVTGIDLPGSHLFFIVRNGRLVEVDAQTWWSAPSPQVTL